jgi:hypothetical protein
MEGAEYSKYSNGLDSPCQGMHELPGVAAHFDEPEEEPSDVLLGAKADFNTTEILGPAAMEAGLQEAGQRWLVKLLRKEVTASDIVDTTRMGGALLLQVCNCMLQQLSLWLKKQSNKLINVANIEGYLKDVRIVSDFLSELMKSGILDPAGEVAALECADYLPSMYHLVEGSKTAALPEASQQQDVASKPVSSPHKKGSGAGRERAATQWRRSRYA